MCGIVGAVAQRDVDLILLEGLRRLEYRGYDSAGMCIVSESGALNKVRRVGKVIELSKALADQPLRGHTGLAHTRWATHGGVTEDNAHPHVSHQRISIVHNGIIENFEALRQEIVAAGIELRSQTDSELIAHLIYQQVSSGHSLLDALAATAQRLHGAYALAVMDRDDPSTLVGTRSGSPLVVGIGLGEHFLASDAGALLPVTRQFVYLEEGDLVAIRTDGFEVYDRSMIPVTRELFESSLNADAVDKGGYRHYMLKEIHQQPDVVAETLEGRIIDNHLVADCFGPESEALFAKVEAIHIIACGTSYHAGLVARYWIEAIAGLPCHVEIASEYRYRSPAVPDNTLFVTISQSGETADTLSALREAGRRDYLATMTICNVPESSLIRESDLAFMTRAGVEIGVASTKAFTTQVTALMLFTMALARHHGMSAAQEADLVAELRALPGQIRSILQIETDIARVAEDFTGKEHALFLGRGTEFPIAMEGALKLKEISYIHAEAYAAGELKHGPLALVDDHLPVIVSASSSELLAKLVSNLQEVRARGGQLYIFADQDADLVASDQVHLITLPVNHSTLSPILQTIPLQLLAYYVAVNRGTDVDQPRNLAKSVTVE